ncbi:Fc receptor-like protein 3 isoform X2 [Scyliorhinus canicula]|uniref:Fc receptor-like protein 3 isoform X2 n=1 Tax=Scyliorhinus canicula TaxID=7830 RepID=UPI0018F63A52|nr:Fc receptor-like protein 3 isoform X2 [Scyliorhinus canicula]XP_038642885.1 Fc receptor-like protein 3 isoform X2 [Scyliorhinus canicula]XP_038642887.1 Fc receptor-like protein 3 isoform X2 [Scyliorhinus canicula]XP_038642888.1 Fc receptor-like protein 3 isoform X2 [Scyliorhinus canicula]
MKYIRLLQILLHLLFQRTRQAHGIEPQIICPRNSVIQEGDTLKLQCGYSGKRHCYWYKNNRYVKYTDTSIYEMVVDRQSGGIYRCHCYSPNQRCDSMKVVITATDMKVSLQIEPRAALRSEKIHMKCEIPRPRRRGSFFWLKNGNVMSGSFEPKKTILLAEKTDEAQYRCGFEFGYSQWLSPAVNVTVTELFSKPELKSETEIFEGEYLSVECIAKTDDSGIHFQYSFWKNNETLAVNQVQHFVLKKPASLNDSGLYHCEANALHRGVGKKSEVMHISVEEAFSKPTLSDNGQVFVGQQLKVTCEVKRNPSRSSLRYVFFRKGQALNSPSIGKSYIVAHAQLEDSGTYLCEVMKTESSVTKRSDGISVKIHPNPVSTPQLTINPGNGIIEGETAWLSCSVPSGTPPIKYHFHKEPSVEIYQHISNLTSITYEIGNVIIYDEGSYYCMAGNQATDPPLQSDHIVLSVIVPVVGASLVSKDNLTVIAAGDCLVLQCQLKKGTAPRFLWYRDNLPLTNNSESYHFNDEGNEFVVHSFEAHHGGRYQCVAINRGIDEMMFNTTSNYFEVALSVRSYSTEVAASVFPLLLITGVIAVIGFKLRQKKQGNSSKVLQPQCGATETRSQPASQELSPANFEFAVIGSFPNIEFAPNLVYSVVTTQKSKTADIGGVSSEDRRISTGEPNDYCIIYATLNHKKVTERLDTTEMEDGSGADTNVYENLPRREENEK